MSDDYELLGLNESVPQILAPDEDDYGVVSNLKVTGTITANGGEHLVPSYDNIAAIRAVEGVENGYSIYVTSHTSFGDGGGGEFRWADGASPATYVDNNGTIIVPTGGDGSAAWVRDYSGYIDVRWFGAILDGVADDSSSFVRAAKLGGTVFIPENSQLRVATAITSTDLTTSFNVVGQSRDSSVVFCDVDGFAITTTDSNARSQWENLTLKGNLSNTNSAGISLFDNSSRTISKINAHNFNYQAIKIVQSVSPVLEDLRIYSVGTGVEINAGATSCVAPSLGKIYVTSATVAGIDFVGSCRSVNIDSPTLESCAIGIRANTADGEIVSPWYESNTLDTDFTDSLIILRSSLSTSPTFENNYSGSIPESAKFLFMDGPSAMGAGGMINSDTRTNSTTDTWESLLFGVSLPSPYINPNPGGSSFNTIEIVSLGLYEVEYSVSFAAVSATAGSGSVRLLKNGTEIQGSFSKVSIPAVAGFSASSSRKTFVECEDGDLIAIQFGVSSTQIQVVGNAGAGGPTPTSSTNATFLVKSLGSTGQTS